MTMTTEHRRITWLLVLILTVPGLGLRRQAGKADRQGRRPRGRPIPGVSVTTTCAEDPDFKEVTTTNEKGIFMVDFKRIDVVYRYELQKAGYVTLKMEQTWTIEGTERHEFKMSPGRRRRQTAGPRPRPRTRRSWPSTTEPAPTRRRTMRRPGRSSRRPCRTTPTCAWPGRRSARSTSSRSATGRRPTPPTRRSPSAPRTSRSCGCVGRPTATSETRPWRPRRGRISRGSAAWPRRRRGSTTREWPSRNAATIWAPSRSSRRPSRSIPTWSPHCSDSPPPASRSTARQRLSRPRMPS